MDIKNQLLTNIEAELLTSLNLVWILKTWAEPMIKAVLTSS